MNQRQKQERKHEIQVGLTLLIGLSILVFAILYVGENKGVLTERYKLRCMMSRVNGLQTGAPVRLAGVRVGSVVKVEFSENVEEQKIEIILEIDKDIQARIREDSEAHIGTMGLLGDKYVGVTMGSLEKRMLENNEILNSSDPVDIEKLLDTGVTVFNSFEETSKTITEISKKVNEGRGTLGLLVNDPRIYYDIDRLLLLMESLSEKIDQGEGTMAKLFTDPKLYDNINTAIFSTIALTDSISKGQGSIGKLLRDPEIFMQLNESFKNMQRITQKLNDGNGSLGRAVNDSTLYMNLQNVASEIDSLVQDIRKNPQRFLKVEIF